MAKKGKAAKPTVNKGATKVANAIAKVYETVGNSGNVVTQCVTSAMTVYKGAKVPKIDLSFIADNVARIRGWSATSSKQRRSEVRVILRAYDRLPEAIEQYRAKHDSFTWHTAIKLARCLGREPSLGKALTLMNAKAKANEVTPAKALANAISKAMNVDLRGGSKGAKFQEALEQLCETHSIDW